MPISMCTNVPRYSDAPMSTHEAPAEDVIIGRKPSVTKVFTSVEITLYTVIFRYG